MKIEITLDQFNKMMEFSSVKSFINMHSSYSISDSGGLVIVIPDNRVGVFGDIISEEQIKFGFDENYDLNDVGSLLDDIISKLEN